MTCRCERRASEGGHIYQQVTDNTWHSDFKACQVNGDAYPLPRVKAYAAAVHVTRCAASLRKAARCCRFPHHLRVCGPFRAGGNTKTAIIVTISPSSTNISESYGSLMFALRAKQVRACQPHGPICNRVLMSSFNCRLSIVYK